MSIKDLVNENIKQGMTLNQAENFACQQIILNKIAKSPMVDKVLIKGGILMFNMTHSLRRVTTDIDFDFIKYDISDESIKLFIDLLNKYDRYYKVKVIKQQALHQEDYKGKRVFLIINDDTYKIKFKLDIGVHTLFDINQSSACFSFGNDNHPVLRVNPCEQIFAEKLYSLAKHGILSTRFKDVFDMYYLIENDLLDKKIVRECLVLLLQNQTLRIRSIQDIYEIVSKTFTHPIYLKSIETSKDRWLDEDTNLIFKKIIDYIRLL